MALSIKLCASIDPFCKYISVKDITGPYSASNVGGWGSPNPEQIDVDSYTLTVLTTAGSFVFDATGYLPGADFSIMLDEIGPPGTEIITIDASVVIGAETFVYKLSVFLYCKQKKIIQDLFSKLTTPGCCDDCSDEKRCYVMTAYNFLLSLEYAASVGNVNKFNELVEVINSYEGIDLCKC